MSRTRWLLGGAVMALVALVAVAAAWWLLVRGGPDHSLNRPTKLADVTDALASTVPEAQHQAHVPGVVLAVTEGDEVAWQQGFGVDSDAVFQAGSISKTVTAATIVSLAEEGAVDLDEPVATYLRSWRLPEDVADPDEVTLRRLLSHTAGFGTAGYEGLPADRPLPTTAESLDGAATGEPVRQTEQPGEYAYSGGGYTIAQQVVEDVTGDPFAEVVDREVLTPLGMAASGYDCTTAATPASGEVVGHLADGKPAPRYRYAEAAAAGLCSTGGDLGRFAAWLGSSDPRAVLMRAPVAGTDGSYGLGLELDQAPTVRHPGVNRGFHAELLVNPADGVGLVVLTDGDRGGEVVDAVLDAWHDVS